MIDRDNHKRHDHKWYINKKRSLHSGIQLYFRSILTKKSKQQQMFIGSLLYYLRFHGGLHTLHGYPRN